MLRQMNRNKGVRVPCRRNIHLHFHVCSLCWIWSCCSLYFCISVLLSRLQKKMNHLILLFSLLLAPAFADGRSQKSTQNLCSSDVSHKRQKRDWIWNQLHIQEELDTPLPHHVGKVSSNLSAMTKISKWGSWKTVFVCSLGRRNEKEIVMGLNTNMLKSSKLGKE